MRKSWEGRKNMESSGHLFISIFLLYLTLFSFFYLPCYIFAQKGVQLLNKILTFFSDIFELLDKIELFSNKKTLYSFWTNLLNSFELLFETMQIQTFLNFLKFHFKDWFVKLIWTLSQKHVNWQFLNSFVENVNFQIRGSS
jgi:hypothetical protein